MNEMPQNPEGFEEDLKALEDGIKYAQDFDGLYDALRAAEVIDAAHGVYSFDQIKDGIEKARDTIERATTGGGRMENISQIPIIALLPDEYGLRAKVVELLEKERGELSE